MKNMKNKILILFLVIIGFSSCGDVLDVAPDGRKSLDEVFLDDATTAAYLNSCYKNFPHFGVRNYFWTNYRIALSDDAWEGWIQVLPIYNGNMTSSSNVQENEINQKGWDNGSDRGNGFWNKHWSNIRSCNVFLSRIGTAKVNVESDRMRWTAEAKTLRAFYNLELIKRYGPLPVVTSPIGLDYDYGQLKRGTYKECVDNIVKDCNEAIAINDLPWRITAENEAYRMTKAIAHSIKSQAILFVASDLWNDNKNHWVEAEKITKEALDACTANGYELYTSVRNPSLFSSAYSEYFCSVTDFAATPIDKETILASSNRISIWQTIMGLTFMAPNKSGLNPTQELVDAYGMQASGKPVLKLGMPYNDERHLDPNYNPGSGYDALNPYVGRDPRFYATVYYNGSTRQNKTAVITTVETFMGGNCSINPSNSKYSGTGYYAKKYDHPLSGSPTAVASTYRIYRLAELYLNYAEAAIENGHIADGFAAMNVVRARASMPAVDPTGLTVTDARFIVRNERRVEMAYEENRYFDNRRYQKPDGDLSATDRFVTAMWIIRSATTPYTYTYKRCVVGDSWNATTNSWIGSGQERACYTNKYLLWPIELNEAKRLYGATGVLWQNPGW